MVLSKYHLNHFKALSLLYSKVLKGYLLNIEITVIIQTREVVYPTDNWSVTGGIAIKLAGPDIRFIEVKVLSRYLLRLD